ncbi:natural killer cells antigen CD94-like, partial [Pteropus vampyrus]|uniref:Natural killer cells antigen CD94-like n=1 Tax=Pteropus vampyrus TaxID=132908 RepID=A0A6P3QHI6_PTEVA
MAGFQTTPWRLISGILGVMCLVLMVTLRMLLNNVFTKPSIQLTPSPGPTLEPQKDSSCQKMWIGYQCNCYFISNEMKTWEESKDFCASKNSSLLQLQNKDELA